MFLLKKSSATLRYIRVNRKEIISIGIIFLFGLTPLLWFRDGFLILRGDLDIPLRPIEFFPNLFFSWQGMYGLPYYSFWAFFKWLGLSLINIEKLWFVTVHTCMGLSMYYLSSRVMKGKKSHVAAVTSAIFYMFNLAVMLPSPLTSAFAFLFMILPITLGLFIQALDKIGKPEEVKYIIYLGIILFFGSPALYKLPLLLVALFIILICNMIIEKRKCLHYLKFMAHMITIPLLINLSWILPFISFIFHYHSEITISATKEFGFPVSRSPNLIRVIRLLGPWPFYSSHKGAPYFAYAHHYLNNPFLILLTFMPAILSFSAPILRRNDKNVLYFTVLCVVSLILATGIREPQFSFIYKFLYLNLPGFWVFREPTIFSILTGLSYSFLAGTTVGEIYNRLLNAKIAANRLVKIGSVRKLLSTSFIVLITFLELVLCWPMLTGDVIQPDRGALPSEHVKIPDYWFELSDWINDQDEDFKVLLLPILPTYVWYTWGYQGADPALRLICKPIVGRLFGYYRNPYHTQVTHLLSSDLYGLSKVDVGFLRLMGVKYIIQRNDIDLERASIFNPNYSPEHIKSLLLSQKGVNFERAFGQLDVYRIHDYAPQIFVAKDAFYMEGSLRLLPILAELTSLPKFHENMVLFFSGTLSKEDASLLEKNLRKIEVSWLYQISNCDSIINWHSKFGVISLSADTVDKQEGNASLKAEGASNPSNNWFVITYNLKGKFNISDKDFLSLWVKCSESSREGSSFYVSLRKDEANFLNYYFDYPSANTWQHLILPLSSPDHRSGLPNLNDIDFIEIGLRTRAKSVNLKVDDICFATIHFNMDIKNTTIPYIEFRKINPTRYEVYVKNATQPFFLVFNEFYEPQWKARIEGKELKLHFPANSLVNSWYVDKKGEYRIIINYDLQNITEIAEIISSVTIVGCMAYLVNIRKGIKRRSSTINGQSALKTSTRNKACTKN